MGGKPDRDIVAAAANLNAVLVTKDADFSLSQHSKVPILWLRFGNIGTQAMLLRLDHVLPEAVAALEKGEMIIELR